MDEFDENAIHCEMYLHLLWSTKNQQPVIPTSVTQNLYLYIYDLALSQECHLVGGQVFSDHIQLVIKFSPDIAMSDMITTLKVATLLWIRTNIPEMSNFEWQKSDFAFSVSFEEVGALIAKIKNSKSFLEEIHSVLDENISIESDLSEVLE